MPAYLRPITQHECGWVNCNRPATQELFNGRNALVNRYCYQHAGIALDKFRVENEEPDYPDQ